MGKMVMALKKLGKKLTGQTVESDNTVGVINEIADKYKSGSPVLYLHSIKLPTYNNIGYAVMSIVLPFDTPITNENFQDLLLPYIKMQSGPTTDYVASGFGKWQVQGSANDFWVTSVSFANKGYGTNIWLHGVGMDALNAVTRASHIVTDEITDVVKELA